MQYATIALAGEVGDLEFPQEDSEGKEDLWQNRRVLMDGMKEEMVDTFIYLIILSIILKVDIGKAYQEKTKFNEQKYKRFER